MCLCECVCVWTHAHIVVLEHITLFIWLAEQRPLSPRPTTPQTLHCESYNSSQFACETWTPMWICLRIISLSAHGTRHLGAHICSALHNPPPSNLKFMYIKLSFWRSVALFCKQVRQAIWTSNIPIIFKWTASELCLRIFGGRLLRGYLLTRQFERIGHHFTQTKGAICSLREDIFKKREMSLLTDF